jgi:tetratricopeptide (TPR) repeat protein
MFRNNFINKLLVAFVCTALCFACQNKTKNDQNLFAQDTQSKNELKRIGQALSNGQQITSQDFETIKQIREKYPNVIEIRNVYQSALVKRSDFEGIINLINEIPASERTREDNLNLAGSYLKLGRYTETVDTVKPLVEANPKDADYNSLLANGYFYLGQTEDAAKYLDAVWDTIVQNKRIDEINTRGIIYFRRKNYEKAIETFNKSIEINPNDITANNTLSRIYAAQGDSKQAEIYQAKTENAQKLITENETKKSRFVQNYYRLEDAWKAKRYEEVITLSRQMIADTDDKNKSALYQYIAESYKALGKPDDAQKVLTEAQSLNQK